MNKNSYDVSAAEREIELGEIVIYPKDTPDGTTLEGELVPIRLTPISATTKELADGFERSDMIRDSMFCILMNANERTSETIRSGSIYAHYQINNSQGSPFWLLPGGPIAEKDCLFMLFAYDVVPGLGEKVEQAAKDSEFCGIMLIRTGLREQVLPIAEQTKRG